LLQSVTEEDIQEVGRRLVAIPGDTVVAQITPSGPQVGSQIGTTANVKCNRTYQMD